MNHHDLLCAQRISHIKTEAEQANYYHTDFMARLSLLEARALVLRPFHNAGHTTIQLAVQTETVHAIRAVIRETRNNVK